MDWDDLRLFLSLARARRLGAAAKLSGQNATTVARRIRRLEARLQTTLFENSVSGYVLTEEGLTLLARVETIETEALAIGNAVGRDDRDLSGPIRVSVSEGFGSRVLAQRIASFTQRYPNVTVDLIASTGFLNPSRREADLAIMLSRPKSGPLVVRKLTDYRLGLYSGGSNLERQAEISTLEDLVDSPLIGYVPDLVYAPELNYLEEVDPRLRATIRSSSIIAQSELVLAGAGFGVLPCFIGDALPGLQRLLPSSVAVSRTFWLVVHRDVRRIARIERFIQWLDDTVAATRPLLLGSAS